MDTTTIDTGGVPTLKLTRPFSRGYFGFSIARADNGLIFEEYQVVDDTVRRKLATSPEQLQKIFDDWHKERTEGILKIAQSWFDAMPSEEG